MGSFVKFLVIYWTTAIIYFPLSVDAAQTTTTQPTPLDEEFQYRNVVVGVAISTSNLTMIPNVTSMESSFREMIFSSLLSPERNSFNATQCSNITVLPIDLHADLSEISEISVLVSLTTCLEAYDLNERLTARYGAIVHLAITEPGCPRLDTNSAITIPLANFRHSDEVVQLIVDMRQRLLLPGWKSVVTIHDRYTGDDTLSAVLEAFSSSQFSDVTVAIYTVDSHSRVKSFERQMEEIFRSYQGRDGNFVVITPMATVDSVLSLAKRMNLLQHTMQWLFLTPDSDPRVNDKRWDYVTERIISDGVNIAFVSNNTVGRGSYSQLFCNLQQMLVLLTQTIENLAVEEYNLYIQVSDEEWDVIKPKRNERVVYVVRNMTENIDDLVQEACDNVYNPAWKLESAEHGKYGKRVFESGKWQTVKGLQLSDDLFVHVVGGFRGRTINVASIHYPPWQIFSRNNTTGKTTYSGLIFEILNHMAATLNFSYQVVEPRDGGTWGTEKFDGTWNGVMRQVINEEVILGAGAFTIRPEKAKVVNFTSVFEREAYTFMVNRPSELSRVLLFAEPFSSDVWICIASAVVIVAPLFYLIHRSSFYYKYHKKVTNRGLFQLKNCFLYIYGALLQQGGSQLPEAVSGRMLIGFWWLFVLVTVTTYSGNLVAFLTFPRVETAVNSIEDIVKYKGVSSWGFLVGSVIESYLKSSNKTEMMKLYQKGQRHQNLNETVLDKVRFANHAYIDWKIALSLIMKEQHLASGKCEFVLGKEEIFEEQIAMIVPRNSPYLQKFNEEIKWTLQSGLIIKWKGKYWPKKDKCSSTISAAAANRTVKIGDMQGSFYLLFLGFFLALVVLTIEYFIFRRHKTRMIDSIKIFVSNHKSSEFWQQKQYPFLH